MSDRSSENEVPLPPRRPEGLNFNHAVGDPPKPKDNEVSGDSRSRPQGIDVSKNNGDIDWAKLKIDFAIIHATDGEGYQDKTFADNMEGARKNHIPAAAYHFFRPNKSVDSQVSNFVGQVGKLQPGDLPPVLDVEAPSSMRRLSEQWASRSPKENTDMIIDWMEKVEQRLGKTPMLYLNRNFLDQYLDRDPRLAKYPLWIADYNKSLTQKIAPFSDWTMWQFTRKGHVDGIKGKVDRDTFNGTIDKLHELQVQPEH